MMYKCSKLEWIARNSDEGIHRDTSIFVSCFGKLFLFILFLKFPLFVYDYNNNNNDNHDDEDDNNSNGEGDDVNKLRRIHIE